MRRLPWLSVCLTPLPPPLTGTETHGLQWLGGPLREAAPAAWSQQGTQWAMGLEFSAQSLRPHPILMMGKALTVGQGAAFPEQNPGAQQLPGQEGHNHTHADTFKGPSAGTGCLLQLVTASASVTHTHSSSSSFSRV